MKKNYFLKNWRQYLCMIAFLWMAFSASAAFRWTVDTHTKLTWDVTTGYISIDVMYFDNKGSDIVDYNSGLALKDGYMNLSFGSNSFKITCNTDGNNLKISPQCDYEEYTQANGNQKWIRIKWKITQNQLNIEQTVSYNGVWWHRGACADDDISGSRTINPDWSRSSFELNPPITIANYTDGANGPIITIPWKRSSGGTVNDKGDIELCNNTNNVKLSCSGSDAVTSFASSNTEGTFQIPVDCFNINEAQTYKIRQVYKPANTNLEYVTELPNIIINAYPQVNNDFAQTFDATQKTIKLTWSISNAPASNYIDDPFVITIKSKANVPTATLHTRREIIEYKGGVTSYQHIINLDENIDSTFAFEICRKSVENKDKWNQSYRRYITAFDVNTSHIKPIKPRAVLSENQKVSTITWDISGMVWSQNTKFSITRINLTYSSSDEIILTKEDFYSKTYEDNMVKICNEYQYKLQITPNEIYSSITPVYTHSDSTIIPTEIGTIKSFTTSKGYYSDKVELTWENEGSFDDFAIERKEYGKPDSTYTKIMTESGSGTSSFYKIKDDSGIPGIVYEYRIIGLVNCANTVISSNTMKDIGFRTPTGDIYGQVTFENGQAVQGVQVSLETEDGLTGQSLSFTNAAQKATIDNAAFLSDVKDSVTIQAWVQPKNLAVNNQIIFEKPNMYSLLIQSEKFVFKAGSQYVSSAKKVADYQTASSFIHVSGVKTKDSLLIYVNGMRSAAIAFSGTTVSQTTISQIGGNYTGNIDEVRIWNKALDSSEIASTYNRYLIGNENDLIGYYSFNYATDSNFYDISYKGTQYNENHGSILNGAKLDNTVYPSNDLLGYKGVTNEDGTYSIRAIPYIGNGTAYIVRPYMGIHQFLPQKEVRFIGTGSQTHTLNFVDMSSFGVKGYVYYDGGNYPVKGVNFNIDGVMALTSNGSAVETDANGAYTLSVPVGIHEVKAVKNGHTFVKDGRIADSQGQDLNYQDSLSERVLHDNTMVKYIGRVAGGTIQEDYPLGHSLSTNNLADNMTVTLKHLKEDSRNMTEVDTLVMEDHFLPSNKTAADLNSNKVIYNAAGAVIYVNNKTGEFVAHVRPETYKITINATGHDNIDGNNTQIDFSNNFSNLNEVYSYADSNLVVQNKDSIWIPITRNDTVFYNVKSKFIKRYTPEVRIEQYNKKDNLISYFGVDTTENTNLAGKTTTIPLYASGNYVLGKPVFIQNETYKLKIKVFEAYKYNGTTPVDEVPTQDATITFNNSIAAPGMQTAQVEVDSIGETFYTFKAGEPELSSAEKSITASVKCGSTGVPFAWNQPFTDGKVFVLGAHQTGTDFITTGPDQILAVLRDPPGSNSSAYLEKGVSFTESSAYTGSLKNAGTEDFTVGTETAIYSWTGVGAGIMSETVAASTGTTMGISHEEEYTGTDTKTTTTTTTTKFSTSDDPSYVGAEADLYIGYSTNITFGSTQNVTVYSTADFNNMGGASAFDKVYPTSSSDWKLVQKKGVNVSKSFGTLFAYPQVFIIESLIPRTEKVRNDVLLQMADVDTTYLKAQVAADSTKVFYVSYFAPNHPDYGKSNTDSTITDQTHGIAADKFNGPSYRVIYNPKSTAVDTITYLNQSIERWENQIAKNEEAKVKASLLQNYSFHSAGDVEYSEEYSTSKSHESSFTIMIGGKISSSLDLTIAGAQTEFKFEESVETTQGGTFTSEAERKHAKGFTLSEDGSDYISVDVCREPYWNKKKEAYNTGNVSEGAVDENSIDTMSNYSTFIFRTQGGATSCPYEGEYVAQYYEPEKNHVIDVKTMKVEVPEIDVKKDFLENVPSGESGYFTLYLRNNSETQDDAWFDLKSIYNPYGAKMYIDGAAIGNGLSFLVPAGSTLVKTLEVYKGSIMNYDTLQLVLASQCQYDPTDYHDDVADTLDLKIHYTPSCTELAIKKPSDNWTYNTALDTMTKSVSPEHYLPLVISSFDVNYDDFDHIELQYKSASQSDDQWITLINYYQDSTLYNHAIAASKTAEKIKSSDAGNIYYNLFMDDYPDQNYDLRAVSICTINNERIENMSDIISGIKDTYNPRLFGSAQPANGILTIQDEIKLTFNEKIAQGYLTNTNFQVTGVKNGTTTDHSTSIVLDGQNDYLSTEFERNLSNKDFTMGVWIQSDIAQDAVIFSHGDKNNYIEMSMTSDNYLVVNVEGTTIKTQAPVPFEAGSWAHVALVYKADGHVSAYYNYAPVITNAEVPVYQGKGHFELGRSVSTEDHYYTGKVHNLNLWDEILTRGTIQENSLVQFSGSEPGLIGYYPMNEGKGTTTEDKARGANFTMNGCQWSLPDGYSAMFNNGYIEINSSAAVVTKDMDYTLEFWFKAESGQKNATILCNGRGDGKDLGDSINRFSIGFDENGLLSYNNNGYAVSVQGSYDDNNWHHFALTVNRAIGRAQIYMDGNLNTYFDSENIGGVAGTAMYMGARGWYMPNRSDSLIVDNYYKGKVDEFRFWELYRTQSLVENYNNEKLDGSEMGLKAYYPFEHYIVWQNNPELRYTLEDQKDRKDTLTAVFYGQVAQSADIAPVKDKGPVSNLSFDFVVNDDALIITLKEADAKIEKTIVTFTVSNVRDMNGNKILSPITWSAYIDRNQLKWGDNSLTITKELYEPLEITVPIVNKGGAMQNYTITNMPSWLTVDPNSGTMNPNSTMNITFRVDEGLNVGTYDEVIYLTNDNGVSEVLSFNLIVAGENPEWTVDPADYKYNMSIYGKLRFNQIFSTDKADILGVFQGGECIGVANCSYHKEVDMWYAMLTVYNNSIQAGNLEFRMWDASTGITYEATPNCFITFINDTIYGTPLEPIIFDGKEVTYKNLDLVAGWNWISFNLANDKLNDVNYTLQNGVWTKEDVVKSLDSTDSYSAEYSKWMGSLSKSTGFKNTDMYMLYTKNTQKVSICGTTINPTTMPIAVKSSRWNYIGYLPTVNLPLKTALAGYDAVEGDVIKSKEGFAMYYHNNWIGSLSYMEANKGYMLKNTVTADKQLIYPANYRNNLISELEPNTTNNALKYAHNMSVIATISDIKSTDKVYAMVNGEVRGVNTNILSENNRQLMFIPVAGDLNNERIYFVLERENEDGQISSTKLNYQMDELKGSIEEPLLLEFDGSNKSDFSVYPIPFNDQLNLTAYIVNDAKVKVEIADLTGRILYTSDEEDIQEGSTYAKILMTSNLSAGSYLIYVYENESVTVKKIIKQ